MAGKTDPLPDHQWQVQVEIGQGTAIHIHRDEAPDI